MQQPPDPKKLMEAAARTPWRAAAWLLERTNPETYARRPANRATMKQVDDAVTFVLESALQAVAPEQRNDVYDKVEAACQQALDFTFSNIGTWGTARMPKLPPTPLGEEHFRERTREQALRHHHRHLADDRDDPAETTDEAPPETIAVPPLKIAPEATAPAPNAPAPPSPEAVEPTRPAPRQSFHSPADEADTRWELNDREPLLAAAATAPLKTADCSQPILSPKMRAATKSNRRHEPVLTIHDQE